MTAPEGVGRFHEDLIEWERVNHREFPWRGDASPFQILIAEILLQQTFAEKVAPVFSRIFNLYQEPSDLAAADREKLVNILEPLGLQNKKAGAIIEVSNRIAELSTVPEAEQNLLELPFVGPYAANAVLCFGFGESRPVVDTNVIRIYNRVFSMDFAGDRDTESWEFAAEMLPSQDFQDYNLALLDLGAEVCTSRNPRCGTCPVSGYCEYYADSRSG